jgi:hypothetical protein
MTPLNTFIPSRAAFILGILVWFLADPAIAQQPTQVQRDAIRQSCRSDYQSYCASVPTGGRASLQCLQEQLINLSPACQSAVEAVEGGGATRPPAATQAMPPTAPPPHMTMRQEAGLLRNACGRDFAAYCEGVRPGGGRGLACLAENQSRLSSPCQTALAEMRAGR